MPETFSIKDVLIFVGFLLVLLSGLSMMGRYSWLYELLTHFKLQYLIGLALISFIFFLTNHLHLFMLFFSFSLLNFLHMVPHFSGEYYQEIDSSKTISYVQFNLNKNNYEHQKVINYLESKRPDLIFLQEFSGEWRKGLKELDLLYPYKKNLLGDEEYGLAIYSKFPMKLLKKGVKREKYLFLLMEISTSYGQFSFLGTHTMSPLSPDMARIRNDQLKEYSKILKPILGPKVLTGDLNISPWSPYFRELLKETNLLNSSKKGKIHSSWPSYLRPFGISIDHFLHSQDVKIIKKEIGPDLGSDHFPVGVSFSL